MGALLSACGGGGDERADSTDRADGGSEPVHALAASAAASAGASSGVRLTADNLYTLYVNGVVVGSGSDWKATKSYPLALNAGDVIAVDATDQGYKAGLIAEVTAGAIVYGSAANWQVSTAAPAGWNTRGFDASGWDNATDYGAVNAPPWGSISGVAGISSTSPAHWIWTSNNPTGGTPTPRAYFRFVVPGPTPGGYSRWSDPATWGGTVPPVGAAVVVPAGSSILLDQDINLATLTVNGNLACDVRDLNVTARWILVAGKLQCGSAANPFLSKLTFTLTGPVTTENVGGLGSKFLGATSGGSVDFYGKPNALTWTQLATNAAAGATQITLRAAPGWSVGDQIVIASTARDMNQAEVRSIAAINGATLTLSAALANYHQGATESYGNPNRTWVLDEGAEVGLLTHNIVIQGDADSDNTGFGGHTMFMAGSSVHMNNVMFQRAGQRSLVGRYPFHWHLAGDVAGQFITQSSIFGSYNRAITVHQTNSALVRDNVAYRIVGHAYFLEDGSERYNVIDHNLGVVTVRPIAGQEILETDKRPIRRGSDGGNFEFFSASSGPATFWITNPENTVTNNAAAGSDGSGFWYHTPGSPTGLSAGIALDPHDAPMPKGGFAGNRAHSNYLGFTSCTEISGFDGWSGTGTFSNFTTFQNEHGAWPCDGDYATDNKRQAFEGYITADNTGAGFFSPNMQTLRDSLFVGKSAGNPVTVAGYRGVQLYDSGHNMSGLHFANFPDANGGAFGISWQVRGRSGNRITGMTKSNVADLFYLGDQGPILQTDEQIWGQIVNDLDGSLTGTAGRVMTTSHPMMIDGSSARLANSLEGFSSAYRYGRLEISGNGAAAFHGVTRSDGATASSNVACPKCVEPTSTFNPNTQAILNSGYSYSFAYDSGAAPALFDIALRWARAGDTVVATVKGVPASAAVLTSGWTPLGSVAAVQQSAGHSWFLGTDGSLTVKLVAAGADWEAVDTATVGPSPFIACAGEGGTCAVPAGAVATVVYGAGGVTTSRANLTGAVACTPSTFGGDPAPNVVKSCAYRVDTLLAGVAQCAGESGSCALPAGATGTVYYGVSGRYLLRQGVTGAISCGVAAFGGDPANGVLKSCYAVVTAPPASTAICANDYGTCTIPANAPAQVTVYYGQNGVHFFRNGLAGSFSCTPATFGGDPQYGVVKSCRY